MESVPAVAGFVFRRNCDSGNVLVNVAVLFESVVVATSVFAVAVAAVAFVAASIVAAAAGEIAPATQPSFRAVVADDGSAGYSVPLHLNEWSYDPAIPRASKIVHPLVA